MCSSADEQSADRDQSTHRWLIVRSLQPAHMTLTSGFDQRTLWCRACEGAVLPIRSKGPGTLCTLQQCHPSQRHILVLDAPHQCGTWYTHPCTSDRASLLSGEGVNEGNDALAAWREAHAVERQLILLNYVLIVGPEGPRCACDHHLRQQARCQTCGGSTAYSSRSPVRSC